MSDKKKQLMLELLSKGNVRVFLDTTNSDVIVPPYLKNQVALVLDLKVDQFGIVATLSFNGSKCYTEVPWDSVLAITDLNGCGKKWKDIP